MEDRHVLVPAPGPLLGRSRSWAAPSLLVLAYLLSLSATPAARAGSYIFGGYSGGTVTYTISGNPNSPFTNNYGTSGGSYAGSHYGVYTPGDTVKCQGAITTTFQWQPDYPGEPLPQSVITQEKCSAGYGGASGTADDGLGDAPVSQPYSGQSSGTRYKVVTGQATITLTCSPSATVTANGQSCGAGLTYSAAVSPVTVTLNGSLADSSHQLNILAGQGCQGILNAGPVTLSNFQWTVPGTTFDHFYISSDQAQGYPVFIDPAVWTTASPIWHWNTPGNFFICTVSATAQASVNGQAIGTVKGQQSITVVTAPYTAKAVAGPASFEKPNGKVTGVQAGAPGGEGLSINPVSVTTPNPFAQFGYWGTCFYVQLFYEQRVLNMGGIKFPYLTNGYVLDNEWPYGLVVQAPGPGSPSPVPALQFSDSPDMGCENFSGIVVADSFKAYLMYQPPGNGFTSQPVPLNLTQWDWKVSANNNNGVWTPDPPGFCTITSDAPSTEFPAWTASFVNTAGNTGHQDPQKLLSTQPTVSKRTAMRRHAILTPRHH